ncbi:MAG: T9SS type A sorting domain-containing protein [Bacteroidota bacterium]
MKILRLLFLLLLLPYFSYSQNCSANPGGDRAICKGDPMVLFGEDSEFYRQPLDLTWTVLSSPVPVQFDQNDILQPTVSASTPGGELGNGTYEFQLRVTCIDGNDAFSTVTVTVGEILNPATITSPTDSDIDICGSSVILQGSVPDPGVSPLWLISPDLNVQLLVSPDGQSVEVLRDNGSVNCDYTVYYFQSIGSCESIDSIQIHFTQEYSSLNIDYVEPDNCPSCSRRIRVCGTLPGCDGQPMWSVVNPPHDVTIESPDSRCTWIRVADDGDYTFTYTIENGDCSTTSVSSTCTINEIDGFGLPPNQSFVECVDTWETESFDLSTTFMEGVSYQWTASSSIGSTWISFSDPNAASTTVLFAGTPVDLPDGLLITITVTATFNGCTDRQRFFFFTNPQVSAKSPDVNLLCGGDPFFMIRDFLGIGSGGGTLTGEVLTSPSSLLPEGSTFNINSNTNLNLTTEGTYSFLITIRRTGRPLGSNVSITCTDTTVLNVFVAEIPTINAGSDIVTCLLATQLNGNQPLDSEGLPVDIPVLWEQVGGPAGVNISDPTDQNPFITGLQFGETYTFRYIFSDTEDCMLVDEMQVQVQPESECVVCELEAKVETCIDGCIEAMVDGAETYLWVPTNGIDDPTSATPTFCNVSGTYTVYGFVGGEACGFAQIEVPACEVPIDCGGFYVDPYCTICGCGDDAVVLRLYDSNGNLADDDLVDITWIVNGSVSGNTGPAWGTGYSGPLTYEVQVNYTTAGGEVCDTTLTGVQICGDDCYNFTIATCGDPRFAETEECAKGNGNVCTNSGYGYLFVLDDLGNLIPNNEGFIYEINGVQYSGNPFLYTPNWEDPCAPLDVRIYKLWGGGCDTTFQYTIDCCGNEPPQIDCTSGGETGPGIAWPPLCGSEYYEVQSLCMAGGWNDVQYNYVYNTDPSGYYYAFNPDFSTCDFWVVRVRGYCSESQAFGPWSDCVLLDPRFPCFMVGQEECEFWLPGDDYYGGRPQGGDGKENEGKENEGKEGEGRSIHTAALDIGPTEVYPNPVATEEIFVRLNPFLHQRSQSEDLEVRIVDVEGRALQSQVWNGKATVQLIPIDDLAPGLYFVTVYSESGALLEAKRLVRQ